MSKKVLIISSSLRADSNSDALAQAFAEGARTAGSEVELVRLAGKTLGFCRGCLACQKTGRCVIRDDGDVIAQRMLRADVLVFATPVCFWKVKVFLDSARWMSESDLGSWLSKSLASFRIVSDDVGVGVRLLPH